MNGFATAEAYDEPSGESYDTESAYDRSDEGILDVIGSVIPGVGAIGNLLGGLRPPLPFVQPSAPARGVNTAVLNTPKGSATIQMPSNVATTDDLRQAVDPLRAAINRNTDRINSTQKDLTTLGTRVGAVTNNVRRDLVRAQREARAAIAKMRKDQGSQNMMNMMVSLLTQQQIQGQLASHTHGGVTTGNDTTSQANIAGGSTNSMLTFLPFMFMGQEGDGGGDSNMMMMMVMMMAFTNR